MKSFTVFLSLVFCLCAFSGVLSQIAGGAQEAARFIGATPSSPPQRYISLPQTSEQEWERLGSTFTLESWVWMNEPASSPTGAWTGAVNESRFLSLISRHPGNNVQNEWAHFHLQLTRTTTGPTVVFWAGCGCEGALQTHPEHPETCGFGYLLSSDSSKIDANKRFWLHPKQWHHIAVTVDGDSWTEGLTSGKARLFIDGEFLLENEWGAKDNVPPYLSSNPCLGRPIYSLTVPGTDTETIHLGYYDNSDTDSSSTTNANLVYGFDGYLDELRIWDLARSSSQVSYSYDLILEPQPSLVGLYNFNGFVSNHTYPNLATTEAVPEAVVKGPQNDDQLVQPNNGLMINQIVVVPGTLPNATMIHVPFTLEGSSSKGYFISLYSDTLAAAIVAKTASVHGKDGVTIMPEDLPYEVDLDPIGAMWWCEDEECLTLPGAPEDMWLSYSSIEQSQVFSRVLFDFTYACAEGFDACGVCGGDNRTCQCVIYHEFRNTRMAYILLTWSLEKIVEKLDTTIHILTDIEDILGSPYFDDDALNGNYTLAAEVSYMMDFYNLCLTDYCADVTEFIEYLDSYLLSLLPFSAPQPTSRSTQAVESTKSVLNRIPLASPLTAK